MAIKNKETLTKHLLRIGVTVVILLIVFLLVYFLLIKPTKTESVFDTLSNIYNYKDQTYNTAINDLKADNSAKTEIRQAEADGFNVGTFRTLMFGESAKSAMDLEKGLSSAYDHYTRYFLFIELSDRDADVLQDQLNDYQRSLQNLVNQSKSILQYETDVINSLAGQAPTDTVKQDMVAHYKQFANTYQQSISSFIKIIRFMTNLTQSYLFESNALYDVISAQSDMSLYLAEGFINGGGFVKDGKLVEGVNAALTKACSNSYKEDMQSQFLQAYINVSTSYQEGIIMMCATDFTSYDQLKNGQVELIKSDYQQDLYTIASYLGLAK